MNQSVEGITDYFRWAPLPQPGEKKWVVTEKYNNCPVKWIRKAETIDQEWLRMWLAQMEMDICLADDITDAVKQWQQQMDRPTWEKVQLISKDPTFIQAYQPQLLHYKLCKDGRRVKLAVNMGTEVGQGTFVRTFAIPIVTIDNNGKIEVKSKALRSHKEEADLKMRREDIDKFNEGCEIQQKALALFREIGWGEPTIAPVPKPLYPGSGLYSQHFFPLELWKNKALLLQEKIQILEDVALAVAAVDKAGAAHLDVRPPNIMLTQDCRGRLIDFNWALEYKTALSPNDPDFPYRGELWKKRDYFPVTKGADLCGLARTLLEICFRFKWDESHDCLLDEFSYAMATRNLPPHGRQLLEVAKKMLLADRKFSTEVIKTKTHDVKAIDKLAQEVFKDCDALWCARELRRIRLKFFPSSEEKGGDASQQRDYLNTSEAASGEI